MKRRGFLISSPQYFTYGSGRVVRSRRAQDTQTKTIRDGARHNFTNTFVDDAVLYIVRPQSW